MKSKFYIIYITIVFNKYSCMSAYNYIIYIYDNYKNIYLCSCFPDLTAFVVVVTAVRVDNSSDVFFRNVSEGPTSEEKSRILIPKE